MGIGNLMIKPWFARTELSDLEILVDIVIVDTVC